MERRQDLGTGFAGRLAEAINGSVAAASSWIVGWPQQPGALSMAAKRAMDVILAAAALVALSPLMAIVALAVRLSSPGPALFHQERVGQFRSRFVMLKFRSMYDGNDDASHRAYVANLLRGDEAVSGAESGIYKLTDDPRVTRVGAFLRRTSLDELPQLFNVLRGHMSLVGPRPALPWELDLFRPEHSVRFRVKPGITGLWQVSGRSELPMTRALELDAEYVRRRSLLLDLAIVLKTIPAVLAGRGAA